MSDPRFRGILYELTRKYGGNVHDKGIVDISANQPKIKTSINPVNASQCGDHPKHVADFSSSVGWYDGNGQPSWILFDFKTRKVFIKRYSIQFGQFLPKKVSQKWYLRGSNDNITFKTIDDRSTETTINKDFSVGEYNVQSSMGYFRFIRFDAIFFMGNYYNLGLNAIEFFDERGIINDNSYFHHKRQFPLQVSLIWAIVALQYTT